MAGRHFAQMMPLQTWYLNNLYFVTKFSKVEAERHQHYLIEIEENYGFVEDFNGQNYFGELENRIGREDY